MLKGNKQITLGRLLVTTILLLILSGIIWSFVVGQSGIVRLAQQEEINYIDEPKKEKLEQIYSSMLVATNDDSKITISMADLKTLIDQKIDEKMKAMNVGRLPIGTVISYMGKNLPAGYLSCNGAVYNISDYQDLAEQIKTEFGSYNYFGGDGETTFAVPDLRGEFLRGTGTSTRNTGTGAAVGAHQNATTHTYLTTTSGGKLQVYFANKNILANHDKTVNNSSTNLIGYRQAIDTSYSSSIKFEGYTSRPTNTAVLYCIKY